MTDFWPPQCVERKEKTENEATGVIAKRASRGGGGLSQPALTASECLKAQVLQLME